MPDPMIEAITLNHNTSLFTELMARSLRHRNAGMRIRLTIADNVSDDGDDLMALRDYAHQSGTPFVQSGHKLAPNVHGEVLRTFVLGHPDCSHYLPVPRPRRRLDGGRLRLRPDGGTRSG